jgi:hypothetical protein
MKVRRQKYFGRAALLRVKASSLLGNAKRRALKFDREFDLTLDWLLDRLIDGCALTHLSFQWVKHSNDKTRSASVDRIDNSKGYTQDNCRLILYGLNALKNTGTDEEMYMIAEALINNRES